MKTFPFAVAAWLVGAAVAGAQEPPKVQPVRADVHFVIGWQHLHKEQPTQERYSNDDWLNAIFYGGAGAGWYWTEHHKTQVDFGAGTEGRQYRFDPVLVNGQVAGGSSRLRLRQHSVAIGQQYQFFRNQWFHPHVGAGVDIARETIREDYDPVFFFDPVTRVSQQISPPRTEGPEHRTIARPFGEVGFKAYMTRRAFFTADTRVMFRTGVDEVLFRFGFGVDF